MAKIIEINKDSVTILMDDNTSKVFNKEDLDCDLNIGQEVDVFSNGEVTIIKNSSDGSIHEDNTYIDDNQNTNQRFNNFNDFHSNVYTFGLNRYRIKKSKYFLLCLLGFTGIQRFMTNRVASGIIILISLLSGILSFIPIVFWVYDLVVCLFTPTDRDGYIFV